VAASRSEGAKKGAGFKLKMGTGGIVEIYAITDSKDSERPFLVVPVSEPLHDDETWVAGPWTTIEAAEEAIIVRYVV